MKRREFLLTILGGMVAAGPAFARNIVDLITEELTAQGYFDITISRTLLGRTRILAKSAKFRREIIVNPRTGEILRDFWQVIGDSSATATGGILSTSGSSGSSNSGSGSGNSGSGSSGSSDDDDDDDDDVDDD